MADCYEHGQSPPGPCPRCVAEGKEVWYRGGRRLTEADVITKSGQNSAISSRLDIQALDISRRDKKPNQ